MPGKREYLLRIMSYLPTYPIHLQKAHAWEA